MKQLHTFLKTELIIQNAVEAASSIAFSDAYDEGQKMTLDEAVAYALEES